MTLYSESKVLSATASNVITDIGKEAVAHLRSYDRKRYLMEIQLNLENGQTIKTSVGGVTKPKLKSKVELWLKNANSGSMAALLHPETGEYVGQRISFSI